MSYRLKGRKVLITGGSRGLGSEIARKFASNGCHICINYASNGEAARKTSAALSSEYSIPAHILKADIGSPSDCERLVKEAAALLGGLDIVVSNAAWTRFSNFADLYALEGGEWDKCFNTNVKGSLYLFRSAEPILNANADSGVFIYTASTAGASVSGSSLAYSVTKAAGLQLMKCLAQTQGPKIRVNSVLPGLLLTEWGNQYSQEFIKKWEDDTPLKSIPNLSDCAEVYLDIARNTSMTGQQIKIDCGWLLAH